LRAVATALASIAFVTLRTLGADGALGAGEADGALRADVAVVAFGAGLTRVAFEAALTGRTALAGRAGETREADRTDRAQLAAIAPVATVAGKALGARETALAARALLAFAARLAGGAALAGRARLAAGALRAGGASGTAFALRAGDAGRARRTGRTGRAGGASETGLALRAGGASGAGVAARALRTHLTGGTAGALSAGDRFVQGDALDETAGVQTGEELVRGARGDVGGNRDVFAEDDSEVAGVGHDHVVAFVAPDAAAGGVYERDHEVGADDAAVGLTGAGAGGLEEDGRGAGRQRGDADVRAERRNLAQARLERAETAVVIEVEADEQRRSAVRVDDRDEDATAQARAARFGRDRQPGEIGVDVEACLAGLHEEQRRDLVGVDAAQQQVDVEAMLTGVGERWCGDGRQERRKGQ
jgi:hypothetical protein